MDRRRALYARFPLVALIAKGIGRRDYSQVKAFLESPGNARHVNVVPVDEDEPDDSEWSPLLHAANNGDVSIVRLLLAHGANLAYGTPCHQALAIHYAAFNGWDTIVRLLVAAGSPLNPLDMFGKTPLFDACAQGRTHVVQILLEAGATPLPPFRMPRSGHPLNKETCLQVATHSGHAEIVQILLSLRTIDGSRPVFERQAKLDCISIASQHGHLEIEQSLRATL